MQSNPHHLRQLLTRLARRAHVPEPRLVILSREDCPDPDGLACYDAELRRITLYVLDEQELAHEFAHHWQRCTGELWPISEAYLRYRFPAEYARALRPLVGYTAEQELVEHFARVVELVYDRL
jgi:hypothetical protein